MKTPTKDTNPWAISVQNLSKTMDGKTILYPLSLKIRKGEICGFLGPNGSGKTTTLRLLCGLLTPDTGSGTCLGHDIRQEVDTIKQHVGYMTQSFSLYEDLSILENLQFIANMYGVTYPKERIQTTLDWLHIDSSRIHQLAGTLSGGWKQRLALAAAVLHQPDLLLLDEPTAGVDPSARREFWSYIHHLSDQGVTTLVSTHYMDEAERCHRLAYVAYGELLAHGTLESLIEHANISAIEVRGKHLMHLVDQFANKPEVTQTLMLGHALHISGPDISAIEKLMHPFKDQYRWHSVNPNLDDIFTHFIEQARKK